MNTDATAEKLFFLLWWQIFDAATVQEWWMWLESPHTETYIIKDHGPGLIGTDPKIQSASWNTNILLCKSVTEFYLVESSVAAGNSKLLLKERIVGVVLWIVQRWEELRFAAAG